MRFKLPILGIRSLFGSLSFHPTPHKQAAAKNTPHLRMEVVRADLINEPLERMFDGIVSSMAMHHVDDTGALFRAFRKHLKRDGFVAVADLDAEDGTFHSHGNEGVHHLGFDREKLRETIEETGFSNVRFHTACTVEKEGKKYPVFLVTATKL
ncbi:MAG: class I SAM-dependent methyltransferase [Campylobacterota bacterium]